VKSHYCMARVGDFKHVHAFHLPSKDEKNKLIETI
jgi:hypothetical protein